MVKLQLTIVVFALVVCVSHAEARGRRMVQQPTYNQYYNTAVPANVVSQPTAVVASKPVVPANGVVQTSATEPASAVVPANSTTPAAPIAPAAPVVAAVGSAQWKAEQSARLCSVQHLGGGFGGGSFEGNGYGATAQQAIQNCCFWGQRTPIEIGVARGANGYYATVFYR